MDDDEDVALFSRPQATYGDDTSAPQTPGGTSVASAEAPAAPPIDRNQNEATDSTSVGGATPTSQQEQKLDLEQLFGHVNEEALQVCGFGRLQWMLLVVLGFAFMGDMVELMVLAFVMPSAERDLCMNDSMKGWLGAITFAGMMIGSPFWGYLSDRFGRRTSLLGAMIVGTVAAVVAAFVPVYWMFLCARLVTGFGVGGSIPVTFTYFGEFCIRGRRGLHMGLMATFWAIGGVFVAGVGWLVIPSPDLQFSIGESTFLSWRVFLLICALPLFLSLLGLLIMPESPRYLLQAGKDLEALAVYRRLYRWNHMESGAEYEMPEIELPTIPHSMDVDEVSQEACCTRCCRTVQNFWTAISELFTPPLASITFILSIVWFTTCFTYYGLTIWFPEYMKKLQMDAYFAQRLTIHNASIEDEIFSGRMDNRHYIESNFTMTQFHDLFMTHVTFTRCYFDHCLFSNITSHQSSFVHSLLYKCTMNHTDFYEDKFLDSDIVNTTVINTKEGCQVDFAVNYSERDVYFDTLLGQIAALPASLICAVIMDKVGRVKLFAITFLVCAVSVFFIWFINTEPGVIAMNCVFNAFIIIGWNAMDVTSTELYPTLLRSTGVGFLSFLARIAAMLGNVSFAQLIAVDRSVPILACAALLALGGLVSFKLPDTTNKLM